MSIGPAILVGALAVVAAVAGLQLWIRSRTTAMRGRPAPALPGELGSAIRREAMLYFHSPNCGPCRAMTPQVEQLARVDRRVHSIDVTRNVHAARAFGVMATPTVIVVRDGMIAESCVGVQGPAALDDLLSSLPARSRTTLMSRYG